MQLSSCSPPILITADDWEAVFVYSKHTRTLALTKTDTLRLRRLKSEVRDVECIFALIERENAIEDSQMSVADRRARRRWLQPEAEGHCQTFAINLRS